MVTDPENQAAAPLRFRFGWQHWVFSTAVAIVLLLFAALAWLDTGTGHRFVVARVAALSPSSGLEIANGSIQASIYNNAVLQDVRFYDHKVLFQSSQCVVVDWWPFVWLSNLLVLDRFCFGSVTIPPRSNIS